MKKLIPLRPVSENPTSVRLDAEDKKMLERAVSIIRKNYMLRGLKLNPSNVLRIVLYEFVEKNERKA